MSYITTKQAAEALDISVRRVQALIKARRLPAEKMGRDWMIKKSNLKLVADRKPGRPKEE